MKEDSKIISMARELAKELQKDEAYISYHAACALNDDDDELQKQIEHYNLIRMNYQQESQKDSPDSEKLSQYADEANQLYDVIMQNKNMQIYQESRSKIDALMKFINTILVESVNGRDPDEIQEPAGGCSGNCGSCAGCH